LRSAIKRVYDDPPVTVKEKLLPDWFVAEQKAQAEAQAEARIADMRRRAKELDIKWPRDWQKAGWKSEKQFLAEMKSRIRQKASQRPPVAENSPLEAA
jgi:hypothetical protein